MRRFARQVSIGILALAVAVSGRSVLGARLDFLLTINNVTNTWELAASTDAPGGIGAFGLYLINIESGISVAPRSEYQGSPIKGFTIGYFVLPVPAFPVDSYLRWQPFAGQLPLDTSTIVYGVGYAPVPDSSFGVQPPLVNMVGSALTVPTVFYTGTYNPANGLPDYHADQPFNIGSVWQTPPPGGYEKPKLANEVTLGVQTAGFNRLIVPEPCTCLLALIALPVLWLKRLRAL